MRINLKKGKYIQEKWKKAKGYDNVLISNCGNVKISKIIFGDVCEEFRKLTVNKDGYYTVSVYSKKTKKCEVCLVHRLVGDNFIPSRKSEERNEIDHKDTNRLNNTILNLRWVTSKENMNNPITKKNLNGRGCKKVRCVTTAEEFNSIKEAGKKYNTFSSSITKCCRNKAKSAGKLPDGTKLVWEYISKTDYK